MIETNKIFKIVANCDTLQLNKIFKLIIEGSSSTENDTLELLVGVVVNLNEYDNDSLTEVFKAITNSTGSSLIEIINDIYDETSQAFRIKIDDTGAYMNCDEATAKYMKISLSAIPNTLKVVGDNTGAYLKIGSGGEVVCYPNKDLLQALTSRTQTEFIDENNDYNTKPIQSFALEMDRTKQNGIKTPISIQGQTPIGCKVGFMIYDFDRGSTLISSTTPESTTTDLGMALITENNNSGSRMGFQVFNGTGTFDSIYFNYIFQPNTYYEIDFYWDGENGDGTNAHIIVDGITYYGDGVLTHSWYGDSTHHLHVGIFEDITDMSNNYNFHGYITHLELIINNLSVGGGAIAVGNGSIVYSQGTGTKFIARNIEVGQWIKQDNKACNLCGFTKATQLYFDDSGTEDSDLTYIKLKQFKIADTGDFKIRFRTNFSDTGLQQQLIWAADDVTHEFHLFLESNGTIHLIIHNSGTKRELITISGRYKWSEWNDIIIESDGTYITLTSINSNGTYTKSIVQGTLAGELLLINEVTLGFDYGSWINSNPPRRARGFFHSIVQYNNTDGDVNDIVYQLICNNILHEEYGAGNIDYYSLKNGNKANGVYYIPVLLNDISTDVYGDVATNPGTKGHNNAESLIIQPDIQELIDADTNNFWFNSSGVAIGKSFDDLQANYNSYIFSNIIDNNKNKDSFLFYSDAKTDGEISSINTCNDEKNESCNVTYKTETSTYLGESITYECN